MLEKGEVLMNGFCMKVTVSPSGTQQVCMGKMVDTVVTERGRSFLGSYCDICGRCPYNEPLHQDDERIITQVTSDDQFIGHVGPTKH
jgi:hypothetical protein